MESTLATEQLFKSQHVAKWLHHLSLLEGPRHSTWVEIKSGYLAVVLGAHM